MVFSDIPMKLRELHPPEARQANSNGQPEIVSLWKSKAMVEYIINLSGVKSSMGDIGNLDAGPKSRWAAETIADYARNVRANLIDGEDPAGVRIIAACFRMLRRDESLAIREDIRTVAMESPDCFVRAMARRALEAV